MNVFFNVFKKIFGNKLIKKDHELHDDDDDEDEDDDEDDEDDEDDDKIKDYFKDINEIYENIIDYLENEQNNNEKEIQNPNYTFIDQDIINDKYKLNFLLHLLCKIAENHNRSFNLIKKIEKIILSLKKEINNNYTNDQIFDIFKTSKKLLYFLFKEKIIISDKHIFNIMNDYKNSLKNYPQFFYPEFKLFFTDELIKEYKINEMNFIEFEEKREIGENDYYIYQLIRDDLVDEFIVYITKTIFH